MIAITGLRAEAGIASAPGVHVFACGGNVEHRAPAITRAVAAGATAIVSFGIAGGLREHLAPGDWVVATGVVSADQRIETDREWTSRLVERIPNAELADIASVDSPVLRPACKRRLRTQTGASAVDMESYQAAALAARLRVPFAAIRVVADPVHRELPPAARTGLQPDGSIAIREVLSSLLQRPGQIPCLTRVTVDTMIAFRTLMRDRHKLGPSFASLVCPTVTRQELVAADEAASFAAGLRANEA